jgi:hypothetical protein
MELRYLWSALCGLGSCRTACVRCRHAVTGSRVGGEMAGARADGLARCLIFLTRPGERLVAGEVFFCAIRQDLT